MTSYPHLAGTGGERELAEYIGATWRQQGLDSVRLVPYDVLLSYPDSDEPSRVVIRDVRDNSTVFTSQLTEKSLRPGDNLTGAVPPYNVYSPPGSVTVSSRIYLGLKKLLFPETRPTLVLPPPPTLKVLRTLYWGRNFSGSSSSSSLILRHVRIIFPLR